MSHQYCWQLGKVSAAQHCSIRLTAGSDFLACTVFFNQLSLTIDTKQTRSLPDFSRGNLPEINTVNILGGGLTPPHAPPSSYVPGENLSKQGYFWHRTLAVFRPVSSLHSNIFILVLRKKSCFEQEYKKIIVRIVSNFFLQEYSSWYNNFF